LGGLLRANGIDNRVLLKEYSVDSLELVKREKKMIGQMMSHFLKQEMDTNLLSELQNGKWIDAAQSRYTDSITNTPIKADNEHLQLLLTYLSKYKAPFTSLLGEMNLNAYYDDPNLDSNQWYRSLGVKPPSPGSVWLAYDYHGLSSASSYCIPTLFQVAKLPPKRGVFGNIIQAPPIPPFKERARYVVHGIMKQMLHAVALTHEAGLVHKSLGRNSFLLSSVGQEKREATNPYAVVVERLRVVLSDWGFAQRVEDVVQEEEFLSRANSFGIDVEYDVEAAMEFAVAEDLHALGFVFLGLLFTTLAEPATLTAPMPLTDDDTWQRLFSELFSKDMDEFREYCSNEEDVWDSVVELLDMEDGVGWSVLGDLLLAREKVVDWSKSVHINEEYKLASARDISNHLFFQMRII
jgi:serine/threonine protein kinase